MTKLEEMSKASFEVGMSSGVYDSLDDGAKRIMRQRMKAVLGVLCVPNKAMIKAATHIDLTRAMGSYNTDVQLFDTEVGEILSAVVDAILKEKP